MLLNGYVIEGLATFTTMTTTTTNWQKWAGIAACLLIIAACFMHWTYYPDIQKHFTGFDTKVPFRGQVRNYYGRPGMLLVPFATICLVLHLAPRMWAKWMNLVFAALCAAYAISRFFMFTNGYSNVLPEKEAGLWLMVAGATVNLGMAIGAKV